MTVTAAPGAQTPALPSAPDLNRYPIKREPVTLETLQQNLKVQEQTHSDWMKVKLQRDAVQIADGVAREVAAKTKTPAGQPNPDFLEDIVSKPIQILLPTDYRQGNLLPTLVGMVQARQRQQGDEFVVNDVQYPVLWGLVDPRKVLAGASPEPSYLVDVAVGHPATPAVQVSAASATDDESKSAS